MNRILGASLAVALSGAAAAAEPPAGLDKINHIVVIYLENRSFDNLYGLFPGAEGLSDLSKIPPQVDKDGKPYEKLPPVNYVGHKSVKVDTRFPFDLPNAPFRAEPYVGLESVTGDA